MQAFRQDAHPGRGLGEAPGSSYLMGPEACTYSLGVPLLGCTQSSFGI